MANNAGVNLISVCVSIFFVLMLPGFFFAQSVALQTDFSTRDLSIAIRVVMIVLLLIMTVVCFKRLMRDYNNIGLLVFIVFSAMYLFRIVYQGIFENSLQLLSWSDYFFQYLLNVFIPAVLLIRFNRNLLESRMPGVVFFAALVLFNLYLSFQLYDKIGTYRFYAYQNAVLNQLIVGYMAALLIALSIGRIMFENLPMRSRLLVAIGGAAGIIPLLASSSRGPILAIVWCVCLFLLRSSTQKKVVFSILFVLIASTFIALNTGSDNEGGISAFDRLANTQQEIESGASGAARVEIWKAGLKDFAERPIFGKTIESPAFDTHPHNVFLEAFMATGLLGGVLFLLLNFISVSRAYANLQDPRVLWLSTTLFVGVILGFFSGAIYVSYWHMCAMAIFLGEPRFRRVRALGTQPRKRRVAHSRRRRGPPQKTRQGHSR